MFSAGVILQENVSFVMYVMYYYLSFITYYYWTLFQSEFGGEFGDHQIQS